MSSPTPPNSTAEAAAIKRAAAGHWPEILSTLGGIPTDVLDGQHHPCPKCQGTDRFRLIDADAGAVYCNNCFSSCNGDGIAAIQHYAGVEFPVALGMLADYLGISRVNGNGKSATKDDKALALDQVVFPTANPADYESLLHIWCSSKPPITIEAVRAYHGRFCRWPALSSSPFRCRSPLPDVEPMETTLPAP